MILSVGLVLYNYVISTLYLEGVSKFLDMVFEVIVIYDLYIEIEDF